MMNCRRWKVKMMAPCAKPLPEDPQEIATSPRNLPFKVVLTIVHSSYMPQHRSCCASHSPKTLEIQHEDLVKSYGHE